MTSFNRREGNTTIFAELSDGDRFVFVGREFGTCVKTGKTKFRIETKAKKRSNVERTLFRIRFLEVEKV
jgi:hypothetical protein